MVSTALINKQIAVPFTEEEWDRFNQFLAKGGMKKGPIVRKVVLEYLDHQNQSA